MDYLAISIFTTVGQASENRFYRFLYTYASFVAGFALYLFILYALTNLLNLIPRRQRRYRYIIVVGSGLIHGTEVPPLLASRINRGIEAWRENSGSLLILSGGQGADEALLSHFERGDHKHGLICPTAMN